MKKTTHTFSHFFDEYVWVWGEASKSEKGEFKIIRDNSKKIQNIGDFHLTNRDLFVIIIWYEFLEQVYALLAQLDRVAHYECEGWGFESLMARQ